MAQTKFTQIRKDDNSIRSNSLHGKTAKPKKHNIKFKTIRKDDSARQGGGGVVWTPPYPELFRWDVVNFFIKRYKYESYLEIGTKALQTFRRVEFDDKIGIDPRSPKAPDKRILQMTSDKYFKTCNRMFDIIFIDGEHSKEQVYVDIENALKHLNKNGTIICHDINIPLPQYMTDKICGTAWQAFVKYRMERKDLYQCAIDLDMIGIIRRGKQRLWKEPIQDSWEYLTDNRKQMLNALTDNEFRKKFGHWIGEI